MNYRVHKLFAVCSNGKESENSVLWAWKSIGFARLSRCMFMHNYIELNAAVIVRTKRK